MPLYTAELLNLGKFPYKSSWIETDSEGRPQKQFDGNIAVRYMEYPVITGIYQYMSMALAKTYSALSKLVAVPSIAEVVMFFNISALGLALAWFATVWATTKLAGRRIWDAALVAGSPIVIFQIFTNFDALATAFAVGAMLAWARRRPALAGVLIGLGVAAKLYPILLLIPLALLGLRTGRLREVGKTAVAAVIAWLLVNLPVMVMFPRGWSEFFRLNTRRGDDMDSLYNVVKSFTDWQGFDTGLGLWQPPTILNTVVMVLFVLCCAGVAYVVLTAEQRPRLAQVAFLVVALFLLTNKVWSPQFSLWLVPLAVLALPHRRILLAWMTIDALVWVPRMLYLYGEQNRGLPEQWFTVTVLLRDIAVIALCALVIRQIYRPELDLVRHHGRFDDPSGGVFDSAPDRPPAWLPKRLRPANKEIGDQRSRREAGGYPQRVRPAARQVFVLACAVGALVAGCSETNVPLRHRVGAGEKRDSRTEQCGTRADGGVRYLALGDSLTQGVGAPDEQTGAFPALLAERWRADGCEVELQNAGISGYTAGQILAEQVPQIESFGPTIVTFQAGGNDIANGVPIDEYRENVKTVLDSATASGARVIVLAQNEWFRSPVGVDYGEDVPAQRAAYDEVLIEETSAHGAEFVDLRPLYAEQADQGQWVEDGIHPTPEAYEAWAALLTDAVPAPCK